MKRKLAIERRATIDMVQNAMDMIVLSFSKLDDLLDSNIEFLAANKDLFEVVIESDASRRDPVAILQTKQHP